MTDAGARQRLEQKMTRLCALYDTWYQGGVAVSGSDIAYELVSGLREAIAALSEGEATRGEAVHALVAALREATTVLDERYHRPAIEDVLLKAADALEAFAKEAPPAVSLEPWVQHLPTCHLRVCPFAVAFCRRNEGHVCTCKLDVARAGQSKEKAE